MGLFSSKEHEHTTYTVSQPAGPPDKALPGIAGYAGTDRLPKNAMPVVRFNYVRPDGKPE